MSLDFGLHELFGLLPPVMSDVCKHRMRRWRIFIIFFLFSLWAVTFSVTVVSWKLGMSHARSWICFHAGRTESVFPQNYERYRFANNLWHGLMTLLPHTTTIHYGIGQCGRHSEERAFLQCLRRADPHYVRINNIHVKITLRSESLLK